MYHRTILRLVHYSARGIESNDLEVYRNLARIIIRTFYPPRPLPL